MDKVVFVFESFLIGLVDKVAFVSESFVVGLVDKVEHISWKIESRRFFS